VREGLIEIVQAEPYAPLHVRAATPARRLRVVADNDEPAVESVNSGEEDETTE
jgi:chromatin segregation and condensation protein Rec8/ScpA/Scc1 (kleisin family)